MSEQESSVPVDVAVVGEYTNNEDAWNHAYGSAASDPDHCYQVVSMGSKYLVTRTQ